LRVILRGVLLLARGRAAGIAEFANSADGLTASLAPLIAFPLVGAGQTALNGQPEAAIIGFLARLSAVLALPVITYHFAKACGRDRLWLRTVTALDWAFWLVVPLLLAAALVGVTLVKAGLSIPDAEVAALGAMLAYVFWLHWFILKAGLQLNAWQALLLAVLNSAAIGVLTDGPVLIGWVMQL